MLTQEMRDRYDGYYADEAVKLKRGISARDSVREILRVSGGRKFNKLLDVGAGEGSVLRELAATNIAKQFYAVEISKSGIEEIQKSRIPNLIEIKPFDGYSIPYPDSGFDLGIATYVLEHVDHERSFLREISRVCEHVIVSVPLENTWHIARARLVGKTIGHVNFYTLDTFHNILETSGLTIEKSYAFTTSVEYEVFLSGRVKGRLKYFVRNGALYLAPRLAMRSMTYLGIALCKSSPR